MEGSEVCAFTITRVVTTSNKLNYYNFGQTQQFDHILLLVWQACGGVFILLSYAEIALTNWWDQQTMFTNYTNRINLEQAIFIKDCIITFSNSINKHEIFNIKPFKLYLQCVSSSTMYCWCNWFPYVTNEWLVVFYVVEFFERSHKT